MIRAPASGPSSPMQERRALKDDVVLASVALETGYGGKAIHQPLTFSVRRGRVVAILGRNGSGKTTLLKTWLGLLPAVRGSVERLMRRTAYVPQVHGIDPLMPMTVLDLVTTGTMFGASFINPLTARRNGPRVRDALTKLDVAELAERNFATLSEGQKQRVLLARLVVGEPDAAFLDEPTAAIDQAGETLTHDLLRELATQGRAIVLISHDIESAVRIADDLIVLDGHTGAAIAGELVDVLDDPRLHAALPSFPGGPNA